MARPLVTVKVEIEILKGWLTEDAVLEAVATRLYGAIFVIGEAKAQIVGVTEAADPS